MPITRTPEENRRRIAAEMAMQRTARDYAEEYQRRKQLEQHKKEEAIRQAELERRRQLFMKYPLIATYKSHGPLKALRFMQQNQLSVQRSWRFGEYSHSLSVAMTEYRRFGKLLGEAIHLDDPAGFVGTKWEYIDLGHLFSKFGRVYSCGFCRKIATHSPEAYANEGGRLLCLACMPLFLHSALQGCMILRSDAVPVEVGPRNFVYASTHYALRNCVRNTQPRAAALYLSRDYYEDLKNVNRGQPVVYPAMCDPFDWKRVSIDGYHSSKKYVEKLPSPKFDSAKPPLLVGIELEIEMNYLATQPLAGRTASEWSCAAAMEIKKLLNGDSRKPHHYALIESDGSIHYGFEIVTSWTGLDVHEQFLSKLKSKEFAEIQKKYNLKSHDTTTCGLHVTVDRAGMSALHRGKFNVFLNHPENKKFLDEVCRRSASSYAKRKHDKYQSPSQAHAIHQASDDHDRYEIANFSGNRHAIEFRGPRGTLRFETIMATMEFTRLVWMFTKTASMLSLNAPAFIDFVWQREHAHESGYLRQYLIDRKLAPEEHIEVPPTTVIGGPATRRFTVQESLVDALTMGFIVKSKDL